MTVQHHFSDQQQTSMRMAAFHHRTSMASWDVIVRRVIGVAILAALTIGFWWLFSALASLAFAEVYVAADALSANFQRPRVDGTWKQDLITGGSDFDGTNLAYGAGIGYRILGDESRPWTQKWSVEIGYRNWGTVEAGGRWVSDEHYTQVMAHGEQWLSDNGVKPKSYKITDQLQGGYLRVSKGFDIGYGIEPYVSAGVFAAVHTLGQANCETPTFVGIVAGPTVGGGVKYDVYHGVKLRAGVDMHWTVTESNHPVSGNQWIVAGGGVEVPLTKFW